MNITFNASAKEKNITSMSLVQGTIISTKNTGVIIGAINIEKNVHDSKTCAAAIKQQQRLTGIILKNNFGIVE